ncbi:hypothetical protein AAHC03_026016 [Spirometra sp. Aus1]
MHFQDLLFRLLPLLFAAILSRSSASPDLDIVTTSVGFGPVSRIASNADYSRKVSVSVGDVLTRQAAAVAASATNGRVKSAMGPRSVPSNDMPSQPYGSRMYPNSASLAPNALTLNSDNSWSPDDSDDFNRVNVHMFGERINSATLPYLQPNLTPAVVEKLRVILGSNFDHAWMSTERPGTLGNLTTQQEESQQQKALTEELSRQHFTIVEEVAGVGKQKVNLSPKDADLIRRWLLQKATCPVQFVWRDLGNRYWPRWIRHAVCKEGTSCSWPSGMRCKLSGTKTLRLLRWYCRKRPEKEVRRRARGKQMHQRSRSRRSLYGSAGTAYLPFRQARPLTTDLRMLTPPRQGSNRQFTLEEQRSKRVKRLVRKLSRSFRGYYCEWSRDEYTLQPECSCQCG